MMVTCKAPAKINLALHVCGQRADGYHLLDTLVGFCAIGDTLFVEPAMTGQFSLETTGTFALALAQGDTKSNLVMRAARLLEADARAAGHETFPVRFRLEKQLPVASGMGGGSADAAAALLALARLWGLPEEYDLAGVAAQIGADVPMCLHSRPLRAEGVGERIALLPPQRPLDVVLANPGIGVATPDVFRALKSRNNLGISEIPYLAHDPVWLSGLRNDLQLAAISLTPEIGDVLEALAAMPGAQLVRMSGSGATCFAIHENARTAQAAASQLVDSHPDWWCAATRLEGEAIAERITG